MRGNLEGTGMVTTEFTAWQDVMDDLQFCWVITIQLAQEK